jgi:WhiB family redox-sensing transcriptional regulator
VFVYQEVYVIEPTDEMLFIEETVNQLPYAQDIVNVQYSPELLESYGKLPELVWLKAASEFIGASDNWVKEKARLLDLERLELDQKTGKSRITYTKETVLQIYNIFHSIPMQGTALSLNDLENRTGIGSDTLARNLPIIGVTPQTRRSKYNNRAGSYYEEDTEEAVNRYIESLPFAQEGWKTARVVGAMLSMGEARAARILEPFNNEAKEMLSANHKVAPHFPPHAVEYAVNQAGLEDEIPYATEEDISIRALAAVVKKSRSWVVGRLPYVEVETVTKRHPTNNRQLSYLSPNPRHALEALPADVLSFNPDMFRRGERQEKQRSAMTKKVLRLSDEQEPAKRSAEPAKKKETQQGGPVFLGRTITKKVYSGQESEGRVDIDPLDWRKYSLCAQTNPEAFSPEKGGSSREAKKICASCDVVDHCLKYALDNDEDFGIWGGLSVRERRDLKKRSAVA